MKKAVPITIFFIFILLLANAYLSYNMHTKLLDVQKRIDTIQRRTRNIQIQTDEDLQQIKYDLQDVQSRIDDLSDNYTKIRITSE
ncbi:MAG: hypothetical protein F9K23_03740 [Bacteroidetes bacterium]|nr:MAG: hypothetical protein F9K23_03740 [Bacteroidota bacterium]